MLTQTFVAIAGQFVFITIAWLICNVSASALHGVCEKNEHCGTIDTFCKNGTCVCRENFAVLHDSCVELATPRMACRHKSDCQTLLGTRSTCKEAQCACKSFHHIYYNATNKLGQCVKNRGLDEICDSDHQCYCGHECDEKIACMNQICDCKVGSKRVNRRCISIASSSAKVNHISALLIFLNILMVIV